MYVDKNIMGHIYENGKENLVLRFIQKHFIKINLKKFILCLSSFVKVCKEQEKKEEHRDGGWQSVFIDRCGWLSWK